MLTPVSAVLAFLDGQDRAILADLDLRQSVDEVLAGTNFQTFLAAMIDAPAFGMDFAHEFATADALDAVAPCRMLRGALNLSLEQLFQLVAQVASAFDSHGTSGQVGGDWSRFADRIHGAPDIRDVRLLQYLTSTLPDAKINQRYADLAEQLIETNPHAVYPTSAYRECNGRVASSADHRSVEAVMSFSTFSSIRMVDHILDNGKTELRDIYRPLGRCICLVDQNVQEHYGAALVAYFKHHDITLEALVYRAMEADKGLATVERMLGDFKRLGVSRNEPVLIAGGGVLADTGGLACALYGRNTPYVMLATSIVTGIDAGPSPRTCCDGFGYKNLLGAYHPPVLCLTDRFFFGTLHEGWLRHGVAEIIKMAIVKNAELFEDLEAAQTNLVETRFGTIDCAPEDPINDLSHRILGGAMRSYIEAEYDNLYETHQCRPHAYGHTWSPGFEIEAGLLHGHAVSICMGLGAHLSHQAGWIDDGEFQRILNLMSGYGLSLWHDILNNEQVMRESHRKIVQKRGGNLVAPVPRGGIGTCGYINDLTEAQLLSAVEGYRAICATFAREGRGIDPLCSDVGLEDPSTVTSARLQQ